MFFSKNIKFLRFHIMKHGIINIKEERKENKEKEGSEEEHELLTFFFFLFRIQHIMGVFKNTHSMILL